MLGVEVEVEVAVAVAAVVVVGGFLLIEGAAPCVPDEVGVEHLEGAAGFDFRGDVGRVAVLAVAAGEEIVGR